MTKPPSLDGAYALQTPTDSVQLYADWAETYDRTFAAASGYQLPQIIADTFAQLGGNGPVLDVGAGTGLVGAALQAAGIGPIDGVDISAQMLAEAALKDCYETLFEGDLTLQLELEDALYAGIISAGTFTHGHIGPDALEELLRIAKPGAVFALTINAQHYAEKGFEAKLTSVSSQIEGLTLLETAIYDEQRMDAHRADKALIVTLTKS
ncbi:MAG: methyltransferase domain-containing protein [Pseudomonadota bacterium]